MSNVYVIKGDSSDSPKEVQIAIDPTGSGGSSSSYTFTVKGTVTDHKGQSMANVKVQAYHHVPGGSKLELNSGVSNDQGNYLIYYTWNSLSALPNIYLEAYETTGDLDQITLSNNTVHYNAGRLITINLVASTQEYIGRSEYYIVKTALENEGTNIARFSDWDLEIAPRAEGITLQMYKDYRSAAKLFNAEPSISLEGYYGIIRYALPSTLSGIIATSNSNIRNALQFTANANIIDPDTDIDAIIQAIDALRIKDLLTDAQGGDSYIVQLLTIAGIDDTNNEKTQFIAVYNEYASNPDFWESSILLAAFTADTSTQEEKRDAVKLAFQIGTITQNYAPLVSLAYSNISTIEDITTITYNDWLTMIATSGVPGTDSNDENYETEKAKYAAALMASAEIAFPSEMLSSYMQAETESTYFLNAASFLNSHTDFDIEKASPTNYFSDNSITDENTTSEVLELKRLWHLCKGYDKWTEIKILKSQGLTSAAHIAGIGERAFVKKYASYFDGILSEQFPPGLNGAEEALRIYKVATKRTAAALKIQVDYSPAINNISTNVYADASLSATDISSNPNLSMLFGSQSYCSCKHCQSSFSPAAYLVDLLRFLELIEDKSNSNKTAWDELKTRRPDFELLKLTCENTNTVMPYIDLVIEVLENAISPDNSDRQTTLSAAVLKAEPEHLNAAVYSNELLSATYPWKLPFNYWNASTDAYLKLVGVEKHEIYSGLSGNIYNFNYSEAKAYLGISSQLEDTLIDNTSFREYYDKTGSSTLKNVPNLLSITGLSYDELINVLVSRYVNPDQKQVEFDPVDSCDLASATLEFDAANNNLEYKRLHKFIKLQKITGWDIAALDYALLSSEIDDYSEHETFWISITKFWCKKLGLNPMEFLAWFADLSDIAYFDKPSHLEQIFLNPIINRDEAVRNSIRAGNPLTILVDDKLDDLFSPVIMAATRLNASDLLLLMQEMYPGETTVDRSALSYLYRVGSFSKSYGMSVTDYLSWNKLFSSNGFISPVLNPNGPIKYGVRIQITNLFLVHSEMLQKADWNITELLFLFYHENPEQYGASATQLQDLLEAIRTETQKTLINVGVIDASSVSGVTGTKVAHDSNQLRHLFQLFFSELEVNQSMELAEGTLAESDAESLIDELWQPYTDSTEAKAKLVTSGGSITGYSERIQCVFALFQTALSEKLSIPETQQKVIADHFDWDQQWVIKLLVSFDLATLMDSHDFIYSLGNLIDLTKYDEITSSCISFLKAAYCLQKHQVSIDDIAYLMDAEISKWFDFKSFPTAIPLENTWDFMLFSRTIDALTLSKQYGTQNDKRLITHIAEGITDRAGLSALTSWPIASLNYAIDNHLIVENSQGIWPRKAFEVFSIEQRTGISLEQLVKLFPLDNDQADQTADQAAEIKKAIKSQFEESEWLSQVVSVQNELRTKQRDALSSYLVGGNVNGLSFADTDALYAYYLLDTEMAACAETSRIKLAISTIQLWIQRIQMGLEPNFQMDDSMLDEWKWRKNYRVWEAARKVFVYPENWIEPELRTEKSPFFEQLEEQLLQDEVTNENVESIYLNYLEQLDDVANLDVRGLYDDKELDQLHVIARSKNAPYIYYHRIRQEGFRWTPWTKIDLDIEGNYLVPVIYNRRLMLFWPSLNEKPVSLTNKELEALGEKPRNPDTSMEIRMNFSEWRNKKWQPKKISNSFVALINGVISENYFFKVSTEESLKIDCFYQTQKGAAFQFVGGFSLSNANAQMNTDLIAKTSIPNDFSVSNTSRSNMKYLEDKDNEGFVISEKVSFELEENSKGIETKVSQEELTVFSKTPNRFKISYPVYGAELLSQVPFFYEDDHRTFFVEPSDENYTREKIIQMSLTLGSQKALKQTTLNKSNIAE